ncbi:hypothetical protein NHX12_012178 [Muraenolepis orangiensis]|uniref:Uncharacterized protein n=1 Tax=Muraenolepis orangiensis TaxID=630683 RepID=A0A9Q0DJ83_9TELE|nr:hypothetical protein NHX12_012178 [Muraenolepis orangiensis]
MSPRVRPQAWAVPTSSTHLEEFRRSLVWTRDKRAGLRQAQDELTLDKLTLDELTLDELTLDELTLDVGRMNKPDSKQEDIKTTVTSLLSDHSHIPALRPQSHPCSQTTVTSLLSDHSHIPALRPQSHPCSQTTVTSLLSDHSHIPALRPQSHPCSQTTGLDSGYEKYSSPVD